MSTKCFLPLLGKMIRVTELDSCGNVNAAGTVDSQVVTNGFITLTLSSEVEDGAEILSRLADGSLCANEKLSDAFKRFTVEIEFCGVNPSLLALVSAAEPYADYADDIAGFTIGEGPIEKWFSLELWTGISGAACEPGVTFHGGYVLLPFVVAGVLGDITVDGENMVTFSLTGAYTKGGNNWDVGPYNVLLDTGVAAPLPTALDSLTHFLLVDTNVAPPPAACSPLPMPPYITSITPATGAAAGGTNITNLAGAGFTGATAVNFAASAAANFVVVSDTKITCTTPAHAPGAVDVTVVKAGGNAVLPGGFTYT
jgi:hypothetical protein